MPSPAKMTTMNMLSRRVRTGLQKHLKEVSPAFHRKLVKRNDQELELRRLLEGSLSNVSERQ